MSEGAVTGVHRYAAVGALAKLHASAPSSEEKRLSNAVRRGVAFIIKIMNFMLWFVLLCRCRATIASEKDSDMELLLVQAIWRHGDRSPTRTFPNDPFQERNWTFGGGGFGQLSPVS
ncbi:hypothetical protein COOONC_12565 [Cooperia oncophora]